MKVATMGVYSTGDYARRATKLGGDYVSAHQVSAAIKRLIGQGAIPDRRAGRQHILTDSDLPVLDAELGIKRNPEQGQ